MDIDTLSTASFEALPLVTEGESKEVRYAGDGEVIIRLKPTIYSYTYNRSGKIPGSDKLRLQTIRQLLTVLEAAGVKHSYQEANDRWIRSTLVLQPKVTGNPAPFRPDDLSPEQLIDLPKAPPIEIVAKAVHSGTPKHRYYRFSDYPTRRGEHVNVEDDYPEALIRFDWRNPLHDAEGTRLADEVLPEQMAEWFINTSKARSTALTAFNGLRKHLGAKGLDLWDICFFIAEDGETMFGEVSPDCLRVRAAGGEALDKDIWRSGGSSETVIQKWQCFADLLAED